MADLLHLVQTAREDYTFREQDVVAVLIGAPKKNLRAVIECFVADFANKPEVSTNPLGMLRAYIRNGDQYENGHSKNNGGATDDADDAWRKKLKRGFQQG